jgi:TATA-box binding protein (TBP) (component of TFIID and TFIIIB)
MPPKKKRNANDNEDVEPARQRPAQISNHVATVYYTRPLKEDVLAIRYGRREHDVFRCCNIKLREPSVSGQLFAPGKMVVSGAKSEAESVCAVWACCRALSSFNGHRILPVNFQTDNIVAFGSVGFALDLPKFYSENSASTEPPESLKDVQVLKKDCSSVMCVCVFYHQ